MSEQNGTGYLLGPSSYDAARGELCAIEDRDQARAALREVRRKFTWRALAAALGLVAWGAARDSWGAAGLLLIWVGLAWVAGGVVYDARWREKHGEQR